MNALATILYNELEIYTFNITATSPRGKSVDLSCCSLQEAGALLKDSRFAALFENPDFEVDTESTEFRLLNPVVTKLDKGKKRKARDLEEEDKDKVS